MAPVTVTTSQHSANLQPNVQLNSRLVGRGTLHLSRVCMKNSTHEERQAELKRAKDSMKAWTRGGRNWDYNTMCKCSPDRATRLALLEDLHTRVFFVANAPNPADLEPIQMPPASAAATEEPASAVEPSSTGEEGSTDSHEDDAGSHDPPWQRNPPQFSQNCVRMNMQTRGLYQKFPVDCKKLMGFKRHLINVLNVPNCQQEVRDNPESMLFCSSTVCVSEGER
ncbi:uncharacterized protein LOC125003942 [Mugil cephalus]|uniref:uncharacterized protein LOC125003942 n=1 Tax=Mugil cephalus TaxID=48193 RepID=UPI001FB63FFF|nr:uncharacterized protein LOC125003942 [Mugil cephalus]